MTCSEKDESYEVMVAGHLCLDILPDLSHVKAGQRSSLLLPGKLAEIGPVTLSTGGAVSNTGLALNQLGIRTYLAAKVGRDLFGQAVRGIIAGYGAHLAAGLMVDEEAGTSYTVIIAPPNTDRSFLHHPGVNHTFSANDVPTEMFARVRLFHFGYPPLMRRIYEDGGEQLAELFRCVKAAGASTSLDIALPDPTSPAGRLEWDVFLSRVLPHVDLFSPSAEEILYMLRRQTYDQLCQAAGGSGSFASRLTPGLLNDLGAQIIEMGAGILALKLGERGLYLRSAGSARLESMGRGQPTDVSGWAHRELWAPCFVVDVAGTTGAGDATIAGFLAGLLRGLSLEETMLAAVAVGACSVEAPDALSGLRTWEETRQRIAAGWEAHSLSLTATGWRYDAGRRLWIGPSDGGRAGSPSERS